MPDTTHSLDDKDTTQVRTPLVTPRNIAFAIVPIGVGLGAIHEVGFFKALGLTTPWKFAAVFPIPMIELLRVTLLFGLSCTFSAHFLFLLLLVGWFFLRLVINGTIHALTFFLQFSISKLKDEILNSFQMLNAALLHQTINNRIRAIKTFIAFLFLVALVNWVVIRPTLPLLGEWIGPTFFFLHRIPGLFVPIIVSYFGLKFIFWISGGEFPENLLPPILSQYFKPLFGIFLLIILAFDSGYSEGAGLLNGIPSSYSEVSFKGRCVQTDRPIFVRAYTTGVIYFSDNQLFWHPTDEKSPCWSFPVGRTRYSWWTITPMVARVRLESLSFDTLTDDSPPYSLWW